MIRAGNSYPLNLEVLHIKSYIYLAKFLVFKKILMEVAVDCNSSQLLIYVICNISSFFLSFSIILWRVTSVEKFFQYFMIFIEHGIKYYYSK